MTKGFDHGTLSAIFARFAKDDAPAYLTSGGLAADAVLTFDQLHSQALRWAAILARERGPVLIYGHKEAGCLVAWWACLLAARPLVPVETDLPVQRIRDIAQVSGARLMLIASARAPLPDDTGLEQLYLDQPPATINLLAPVPLPRLGSDPAYILFSSGTTGRPKGIQVSYDNLEGFVRWLDTALLNDLPLSAVTGNVRYCFDVSLFELWASWLRRVPIVAIDHAEFFHSRRQIARYNAAGVGLWVSTPSVAQVYLRDPAFSAKSLPALRRFLFCGEILPKPLVAALWDRFPGADVINTYGPTECTVAVTSIRITPAMLKSSRSLPIGRPRAGCLLFSEAGEIIIKGDVVGPGYVCLPEKQAAAFPEAATYRTGDRGELGPDGLWYFKGRGDREVKIQGIRIDLDEIEGALRALPGIEAAAIDLQVIRGIPRAMAACVAGPTDTQSLSRLAKQMASGLPPAMVPRFWHASRDFSVNLNSKLDRAALVAAARNGDITYVHD
jgi:D-alanine--poly(phosphoribitol) ligase subunit 1